MNKLLAAQTELKTDLEWIGTEALLRMSGYSYKPIEVHEDMSLIVYHELDNFECVGWLIFGNEWQKTSDWLIFDVAGLQKRYQLVCGCLIEGKGCKICGLTESKQRDYQRSYEYFLKKERVNFLILGQMEQLKMVGDTKVLGIGQLYEHIRNANKLPFVVGKGLDNESRFSGSIVIKID